MLTNSAIVSLPIPPAIRTTASMTSRTDQLVIESVVRIARGLGKETIAEFVSTPELEAFVREQGVDYARGFEVGRPVPIAELGLGRHAARVS